ncbi:MAG: hypothetical protein IT204_08495, partial [Fimbriimonadaceae bacterium]|nr:hypothetical protein [Fimbriimonadaceae bacterium]
VVVAVSGANTATPTVTDHGDGTYRASYTPTVAGSDQVAITLGGTAIGGSPYASLVAPGAADGSKSTASVPDGTAWQPTTNTVQARDALGNARLTGGDTVAVSVSGANSATATVTDHGDGTYTAVYTPQLPGTNQVAITLGGTALGGSPFDSQVAVALPDRVQSAVAVSPATIGADGGDAATFTVTLHDAAGHPVAGLPGDQRSATAASGLTLLDAGTASDAAGVYSFTATASSVAHFDVTVTAGGVALSPVGLDAVPVYRLQVPAGISYLAVPAARSDASPEATFGPTGWRVARWAAAPPGFAYRQPGDPADPLCDLLPGRGIWVRLDSALDTRLLGAVPTATSFDLALAHGWSNAGNPFDHDLPWDLDAIRVFRGSSDLGPLSQTSLWGLVRPYVWIFDRASGEHQLVYGGLPGTADRVPRLSGCWALTNAANVTLRLPATPPASRRRAATAPSLRDWTVALQARAGGGPPAAVTVGVSHRLHQALDLELPPQPERDATPLLSLRSAAGGRLAGHLQPAAGSGSWDLLATSRQAGPLTLTWPSLLRQAPRGLVLTLTDPTSGQRTLLNTRSSLTWQATAAGEQRQFTLTARVGNLDRAAISSLSVAPNRGRGLTLPLVLSGPAEITVTVRGPSGRLVRETRLGTQPAGPVAALWDGLDQAGRAVPAGSYRVEATALSPNGAQSRVTRTVTIR